MTDRAKRLLTVGIFTVMALIAAVGFHEAGHQYRDFRLAYGKGTYNITDTELILYLWYFVFGLMAVGFLTIAFARSEVVPIWKGHLKKLFARRFFVPLATLVLLVEVLLFQSLILQYAPVADDENTYVFIAKTLLKGRVANPLPGDPEFFRNQFIIMDGHHWYGKYPIGQPLLLALGQAIGLRFLVVPLVACGVFLMTYVVGRRLFSHNQACLALCLLLLSPHFVFVAGSQLSQPASSLAMMLGLWAVCKIANRGGVLWPTLAGLFFGYALLVRPFPGCLFVVAAGVGIIFGIGDRSVRFKLTSLAVGAIPIFFAVFVLLVVNRAQTGNPLQSGYDINSNTVERPDKTQSATEAPTTGGDLSRFGFFGGDEGAVAVSVGGSMLRQNFWLFGWPLSLIFVFFARSGRHMTAFWGMIAAVYAYRFLLPKTCVATLGPVYMTEIVPLLALASASGMARVSRIASGHESKLIQRLVPAAIISFFAIAAITFIPVQLREIRRSTTIWRSAYQLIEKMTSENVLVFANWMVHPYSDTSWAGYPPPPSPDLDDRVVFVRELGGEEGPARSIEFWRRRFPDRSAWLFRAERDGAILQKVETPKDFQWFQGNRQ
jgi:hypothetical protein